MNTIVKERQNYGYFDTFLIVVYSFVPFGSHFVRSALSVFVVYLISDDFITPGDYSLILNISFIPALIIPIFFGIWLDQTKNKQNRLYYAFLLIIFTAIGQILFGYAVSIKSFGLCILSQVIIGIGSCSVIAAQRTMIMEKFVDEKTFATGCYVSAALFAKLLGQACVSPIVKLFNESFITAIYASTLSFIIPITCIVIMHFASAMPPSNGITVHSSLHLDTVSIDEDYRRENSDAFADSSSDIGNVDSPPPEVSTFSRVLRNFWSQSLSPTNPNGIRLNPYNSIHDSETESLTGKLNHGNGNGNDNSNSNNVNAIRNITKVHFSNILPNENYGSYATDLNSEYDYQSSLELQNNGIAFRDYSDYSKFNKINQLILYGKKILKSMSILPIVFWLFIMIHSIYVTSFHAVNNFLPHYVITMYSTTIKQAGYISSGSSLLVRIISFFSILLVNFMNVGYFCFTNTRQID